MARSHRIGTAGHLAVASIFARRGYNVAIPMIDEGEDLLVRHDATSRIWSVQVKTAKPGTPTQSHNRYQFSLRKDQLEDGPGHLWYILVWPSEEPTGWGYFVIRRDTLEKYYRTKGVGSSNAEGKVTVWLSVPKDPKVAKFTLSKTMNNVGSRVNAFHHWPDILPAK